VTIKLIKKFQAAVSQLSESLQFYTPHVFKQYTVLGELLREAFINVSKMCNDIFTIKGRHTYTFNNLSLISY